MEDNKVITVCPKQMGGLPTPRVPKDHVTLTGLNGARYYDQELF